MKKIVSAIIAMSMMLAFFVPVQAEETPQAQVVVEKTNWAAGTSGTLSVKDASGNVLTGVGYNSDNAEVVTVADGVLTAVAAGEAVISAELDGYDVTPVTVTVHAAKAADLLVSDLSNDIAAGELDASFWTKGGTKFSEVTKPTEILGWYFINGNSTNGIKMDEGYLRLNDASYSSSRWHYGALVYKIDEPISSLTVDFKGTETGVTKHTEIAYLTKDTVDWKKTNASGAVTTQATVNLLKTDLNISDIQNATRYNPNSSGTLTIDDDWNVLDVTWKETDNDGVYTGTADIPPEVRESVKYVLVWMNRAKTEKDPDAGTIGTNALMYGGITFDKAIPSIVAAEQTADGRIAVSYNADAGDPDLTITLDGAPVNAIVAYDDATYTSYITAAWAGSGDVEITAQGTNGTGTVAIEAAGSGEILPAEVRVAKTNWTAGSTGTVTVEDENGGAVAVKAYGSSDNDVVTVDAEGNITAKGEGTATISAVADGYDVASVDITVYASNYVVSDLSDDIAAGKLNSDFFLWAESQTFETQKTADTMLHGWLIMAAGNQNTEYVQINGAGASGTPEGYLYLKDDGAAAKTGYSYAMLVYKVEPGVKSITADFWGGTPHLTNHTKIGYLTSDKTNTLALLDKADMKNTDVKNAVRVADRNPNEMEVVSDWDCPAVEWTKLSANDWFHTGKIDVPEEDQEDIRYVLVWINPREVVGVDENRVDGRQMQYGGIAFDYGTSIVASEKLADGRIAITYDRDVIAPELAVTLNGEVVENPTVSYDPETFTSYVSADWAESGTVEITAADIEGKAVQTVTGVTPPAMELTLGLVQADGTATLTATAVNPDSSAINFFIAAYDSTGKLLDVKMETVTVNADGTVNFTKEMKLTGLAAGAEVKGLAWTADMNPVGNSGIKITIPSNS